MLSLLYGHKFFHGINFLREKISCLIKTKADNFALATLAPDQGSMLSTEKNPIFCFQKIPTDFSCCAPIKNFEKSFSEICPS